MTAAAVASGLGASLTTAVETTYGTAATLTRGFEFENENLKWDKMTKQGLGLRAGRLFPRESRRKIVGRQAAGDITMQLLSKGFSRWLKHGLGAAAVVQIGSTTAFTHTFTPATLGSLSQTIQIGRPDSAGTMRPFTYLGCVITEWELGVDQNELAMFKAAVDARDCDTAAAYTTPDYTLADAAGGFSFAEASLKVAGSGTAVAGNLKFGLKCTNALKTDRFHTGQAGKKKQPIDNGFRQYAVTGDSEFFDLATWVARKYSDETFAIELRFDGDDIDGTSHESLVVSVPAVKLNGDEPNVAGPDVLEHSLDIEILDNDSAQPISVVMTTTDTAV